ncbi:hypothetical protein [Alkalimarinus coralli]|uniref:hypothetical protein n=1 Tax=Alkalimarinus coralli TaxID=2935863 RepID=UPI00202ACEF4|nr:hypothetical protein [Alkalimarinus coralli]
MQGTRTTIPISEKTFLYLSSARKHLGLAIAFALTLPIPFVSIWFGLLGDELLILPLVAGFLFFLIPYFIFSMLKSSISHYYEVALINKFGIEATATVKHKSIEDNSYFSEHDKHKDEADREKIEEITYFIEYEYHYGKPCKSTFIIGNKALYNAIDIGSELPIKLLPSSPDKSAPRRESLARAYGFKVSDCQ